MKVTASLVVTEEDGTEFAAYSNAWAGLSRDAVTYVEGELIGVLDRLNKIAQQENASNGKGSKK